MEMYTSGDDAKLRRCLALTHVSSQLQCTEIHGGGAPQKPHHFPGYRLFPLFHLFFPNSFLLIIICGPDTLINLLIYLHKYASSYNRHHPLYFPIISYFLLNLYVYNIMVVYVEGACEFGNELSDSIKCGEFLD